MKYKVYNVGDWVEVNHPKLFSRKKHKGVIIKKIDEGDGPRSISYFVDCVADGRMLNCHIPSEYVTGLSEDEALLCKLGH